MTIIQYGDTIELRIDNQSFTHLYNLQKNKELFAGEKCPTSKVNVVKSNNIYGINDEKKYQIMMKKYIKKKKKINLNYLILKLKKIMEENLLDYLILNLHLEEKKKNLFQILLITKIILLMLMIMRIQIKAILIY